MTATLPDISINPDKLPSLAAYQPNWLLQQAVDHYRESMLDRNGPDQRRRHREQFVACVDGLLLSYSLDQVIGLVAKELDKRNAGQPKGSRIGLNRDGEAVIRKLALDKATARQKNGGGA